MTKSPYVEPTQTIAALFAHACHLQELGHIDEAKTAYMALLAYDSTHFGALNNLGNLVYAAGFTSAARTAYLQAITHHPDNPKGHVNLANLFAASGEMEAAAQHFEAALKLDPEHIEANRGLAYLLTETRDEERAVYYRQKAFRDQPVLTLPYRGKSEPVEVLLLASVVGGMVPMRHHFDETVFQVSVLFVEFYNPAQPLPPHQLVFNAIGDADLCKAALGKAMELLTLTDAPVINHPSRVILTGRSENAARLSGIKYVITPATHLLPKKILENINMEKKLTELGFTFPLLLRAPGYHTGRFFTHVENVQELIAGLVSLPGEEVLVIQYIDTRDNDGKIRKYRAMFIDGAIYPLHLAVSKKWKVHYFTAEMADNAQHRAEDAAFLDAMPERLGARAAAALAAIRDRLGLDYGGIDFGLTAEGEVVLFEANATMVVYPPGNDARWDYRRAATQRVLDAVRRLLVKYAR